MSWTDERWETFIAVVERGFASRQAFTEADADVYRLLLDDVDPAEALTAVKQLVAEGVALRPKPGEIVARCRRDPSKPTFDEAYRLIFGRGGALRVLPPNGAFDSEGARWRAHERAMLDRAKELHPLIAAFVARQGIDRLRALPLDDPDWGERHRRDLQGAWERHVEAFDRREVAAIASGRRDGLRQLDPLAALGLDGGEPALDRTALETGES